MLEFIIGLFTGAFIGVALMCILSVAGQSDHQETKEYNHEEFPIIDNKMKQEKEVNNSDINGNKYR
jgi:hypothetical protein